MFIVPAGIVSVTNNILALGLGDQVSISGRVIPKTQKMVLDDSLLNTQSILSGTDQG